MQIEIKEILESNFVKEELFINSYYNTCKCYVISDVNNCYEITRKTKINFVVASVIFVKNETKTICMLATSLNFKRRGYAEKLLKCVTEIYKNNDLYVRVSNSIAIELYKKCKFKIIEEIPNFYEYTGVNESAYHMIYDGDF